MIDAGCRYSIAHAEPHASATPPHVGVSATVALRIDADGRVWHDVRTCGNRTNLAASRERRRSGAVREPPDVV